MIARYATRHIGHLIGIRSQHEHLLEHFNIARRDQRQDWRITHVPTAVHIARQASEDPMRHWAIEPKRCVIISVHEGSHAINVPFAYRFSEAHLRPDRKGVPHHKPSSNQQRRSDNRCSDNPSRVDKGRPRCTRLHTHPVLLPHPYCLTPTGPNA